MTDPHEFQQSFFCKLGHGLHLSQLFEYLPEVYLYVKDADSRFVKANRASARMHGCTSELQMLGKSDYDFHPRSLADQYVAEDRRVMQLRSPIPNQVWLVSDHAGNLKWYLSTKIPLFDARGEAVGIAGAMRDFETAHSILKPYREMEQVLAYVVNHYSEKVSVKTLAALTHLSISQFDRRFKHLFRMTPQQYIMRVRVNAACQALTTSQKSVAQIANDAGFYDQSYFTRQFKRHLGMTPLKYRQQYSSSEF